MREAREKDSDAIVEMMDVWCRELVDTGGAVEREMDKVGKVVMEPGSQWQYEETTSYLYLLRATWRGHYSMTLLCSCSW